MIGNAKVLQIGAWAKEQEESGAMRFLSFTKKAAPLYGCRSQVTKEGAARGKHPRGTSVYAALRRLVK